ncbi:hypothetical protein [Streptomyces sp. NPDC097619]|uniref:hypothetical protein n=1 Tax=Streptomyces sp. NPDC097619 TaxID=3157228 RepID=UPI00332CBA1F
MSAGWGLRTLRAAVFAASCVLLTSLGHVMMAGEPVPPWALVLGTVLVGVPCWLLAGRERRTGPVLAAALAAQGALHVLFTLTGPGGSGAGHLAMRHGPSTSTRGTPSPVAAPVHEHPGTGHVHAAAAHPGGHAHGAAAVLPDAPLAPAVPGPGPGAHTDLLSDPLGALGLLGSSGAGMLAAHLLAALLCALWLARGERAAFRVLGAFAARLLAPLPPARPVPVPHRPRVGPRPVRAVPVPRGLLLTRALTFRGPPAVPAVR